MPLVSRRQFIWKILSGLPLLSLIWSMKASATSSRKSTSYISGSLAPNDEVELSANLFLDPNAILLKQRHHQISGEGHTHEVVLNNEAWARLLKSGQVIVRSAMGGGASPHSHWVLVKIL